MKLLLFDIDGTILLTQGLGRRSVEAALSLLFGRPVATAGVAFSGRTDPEILQDVLLRSGLSAPEAAALLPEALALYVDSMREALAPERVEVLPGVRALLDALATESEVVLGLLTGNLQSTAYLKLDAAGLAHFFPFGAFGCDHAERTQLPPVAVHRAETYSGHSFRGKDVVIIGDTQYDIRCGHSIGAFSVGVCTGRFTRADLEPLAPDLLLDDLCDRDRFIRSVLRRSA